MSQFHLIYFSYLRQTFEKYPLCEIHFLHKKNEEYLFQIPSVAWIYVLRFILFYIFKRSAFAYHHVFLIFTFLPMGILSYTQFEFISFNIMLHYNRQIFVSLTIGQPPLEYAKQIVHNMLCKVSWQIPQRFLSTTWNVLKVNLRFQYF